MNTGPFKAQWTVHCLYTRSGISQYSNDYYIPVGSAFLNIIDNAIIVEQTINIASRALTHTAVSTI